MLYHSYTFQYTRNEFLFKAKIVQIEQHATSSIARCNEFEIEFRKCPRSLDSARITVRNFRSSAFSRRGETISRSSTNTRRSSHPSHRARRNIIYGNSISSAATPSLLFRDGALFVHAESASRFSTPQNRFSPNKASRVASPRLDAKFLMFQTTSGFPSPLLEFSAPKFPKIRQAYPLEIASGIRHTHTHTHTRSSPIRKSD